jgi:type II secretory pathway predicted ATPase ExeA
MADTNEKLPPREETGQRAPQKYVSHGFQNGDELADWLTAENALAPPAPAPEQASPPPSPEPSQSPASSHSYLDFFGLHEQPFGVTPDPAYLYASRTHSDALDSITSGIADNRGFLALIAEPGMGKTTLLYRLMEQLRDSARTVLVFQTQCTSRELVEYILQDQGFDVQGMSMVAMHGKLNEILFEELLNGKRFVLVVDEAQNLDESVLETVRMLSNFETHNTKLLQIILAGQPQLADKLAQPRLAQLRQRVSVLARLEPFSLEETGNYIEHRLKVAGHHGQAIFDPLALMQISWQSQGIPRNINNLCYHSLQLAHAQGVRTVTVEIVQQAAGRLGLEVFVPRPLPVPESFAAPLALELPAPVSPVPSPSPAVPPVSKSPAPRHAPLVVPNIGDGRQAAQLTYDPGKKASAPKWPIRSAMLTIVLLSGTLLLAMLGRSAARQGAAPATLNNSSDALGTLAHGDPAEASAAGYDAAPQDTGNGQVLTVVAGPQQTLKDLSLRYAGRFDEQLAGKIRSLNPDLKDPDHLEAGQLIRIPLPPGAMRKTNDTNDATSASSGQEASGSLFTRFTALLRARR